MNTRIWISGCLALFLVGCHTTKNYEYKEIGSTKEKEEEKIARVDRTLTSTWGNIGRGGAAYRQPAYINVLGPAQLNNNSVISDLENTEAQIKKTLEQLQSIDQDQTNTNANKYSLYELQRWERFCEKGKGMDEKDWLFIESEGLDRLPMDAISNCSAPNYSYQDYLIAWKSFCQNESISAVQKKMIKDSVLPYTLKSTCKDLIE